MIFFQILIYDVFCSPLLSQKCSSYFIDNEKCYLHFSDLGFNTIGSCCAIINKSLAAWRRRCFDMKIWPSKPKRLWNQEQIFSNNIFICQSIGLNIFVTIVGIKTHRVLESGWYTLWLQKIPQKTITLERIYVLTFFVVK